MAAGYGIDRETVRGLRLRKMMTQQKLADVAGVSKQTIVRMESGSNVAQFETIKKVATALDTEPEVLIVYDTPENERRIQEAQRDWEQRSGENGNGENGDPGNRGA